MAKDLYHYHVKAALQKDGWLITHDGYRLGDEEIEFEVDLGAEKLIAAAKGLQKILVEVKRFQGQSKTYDFHQALGQFNNYYLALEEQEPDRELYLAVPDTAYENFFQKALIQKSISRYQVKLLVFDPLTQEIVLWKE